MTRTHPPTTGPAGAAQTEGTPMDGVLLDRVRKQFDSGDRAALDVDALHIPGHSLTVVVGPSGCGKSTALRMISGLETPTSGRVFIDGADVTEVAPGQRGVAMVFQDFALYPHMTVERNISFGLRLEVKHKRRPGLDHAEVRRRVAQVSASLGLTDLLGRRPAQLSGGERQRVGLARAMVRRPGVLLLDEPLSALDAQLRNQARAELVRVHRQLGNTVVLVTHDQLEALSMATHLVVMNAGRVLQAGSPTEVYRRPADTFVATFLGSPPMNLATVAVHEGGDRLGGPDLDARLPGPLAGGPGEVLLGWRPGDGVIDREDAADRAGLRVGGVVDVVEFTGDTVVVQCVGECGRWAVLVSANGETPAVGSRIAVRVPADRLHVFDPATGSRLGTAGAVVAHQ